MKIDLCDYRSMTLLSPNATLDIDSISFILELICLLFADTRNQTCIDFNLSDRNEEIKNEKWSYIELNFTG